MLISCFLSPQPEPVYTARPPIRGCCIAWFASLHPSFCWFLLRLSRDGWPDGVDSVADYI